MSFNLLENPMWKNRFQFLSICLDIAFVFASMWWDEPGWMPGATQATLSLLSRAGQGRGNTMKDAQGQDKDKENMGLSHGRQSSVSFSSMSPSHGPQVFVKGTCSRFLSTGCSPSGTACSSMGPPQGQDRRAHV